MSNVKTGSGIGAIVKSLFVTFFKLIAITLAFACKIAGMTLTKLSELLEKMAGNGTNH